MKMTNQHSYRDKEFLSLTLLNINERINKVIYKQHQFKTKAKKKNKRRAAVKQKYIYTFE